jgi:hypothetical protein
MEIFGLEKIPQPGQFNNMRCAKAAPLGLAIVANQQTA